MAFIYDVWEILQKKLLTKMPTISINMSAFNKKH